MTNAAFQKRLEKLEAELKLLKLARRGRPDLSADGKVWRKMRSTLKKARADVYKARYG